MYVQHVTCYWSSGPSLKTSLLACSRGFGCKNERGRGPFRHGDKGVAAVISRDKEDHFLGVPTVIFDGLVDPASLEAHACNEALALVVIFDDWSSALVVLQSSQVSNKALQQPMLWF